jgi:hypothetical protein
MSQENHRASELNHSEKVDGMAFPAAAATAPVYEDNDRGNREFLQDVCMFANMLTYPSPGEEESAGGSGQFSAETDA